MPEELNVDDERKTIERFNACYEDLVNETENPKTLKDRQANGRLKDALRLMEYLRGEDDDNPLDEWFN